MTKRLGNIVVLLILLSFPAYASMVSFLVVETGISDDIPNNQLSSLWGGGLMAAFFDAGYIVTDSPVVRMEQKPSKDLSGKVEETFNEATSVGSEYFILGFLEYEVSAGRAVPVNIAVKLYETSSKKLIYEQVFPVGKGRNLAEEHQFAQNAGRTIISHMKDR